MNRKSRKSADRTPPENTKTRPAPAAGSQQPLLTPRPFHGPEKILSMQKLAGNKAVVSSMRIARQPAVKDDTEDLTADLPFINSRGQFLLVYPEEPGKYRYVTPDDREFVEQYVDHNIVDAVARFLPGTNMLNISMDRVTAMVIEYKSGRKLAFNPKDVPLMTGPPGRMRIIPLSRYEMRNGFIYPVLRGHIIYHSHTTPNLIALRAGLQDQVKELERLAQLMELTGFFAGLVAMSAGFLSTVKTVTSMPRVSKPRGPDITEKIPWGSWDDYPKKKVGGQEVAVVGKRYYSREAVDRMQPSGMRYRQGDSGGMPEIRQTGGDYKSAREGKAFGRSIPPEHVEWTITNGTPTRQKNGNTAYKSGSLKVIVSPKNVVVTIINE
jgi:hypothetical protein